MKKLFITGMLLGLSVSVYAQSANDLKRFNSQKGALIKKIEVVEAFLNEDRAGKFTCHVDFQAPFEELQKVALEKTAVAKTEIEKEFTAILDGTGKNGLKTLVAEIEARKVEIKAEKNKIRKKELKKALAGKIQQAQDVAQLARNEMAPKFTGDVQSLITVGGTIQMAMSEDTSDLQVTTIFKEKESIQVANGMSPADIFNQNIKKLLNSCTTKDCVYLMAAEIKNYFVRTFKVNATVKIISGVAIEKSRTFSKKHIFGKLDEIVDELAKGKPLADLDPACLPQTKPTEPPGDDPTHTDPPVDPPTSDLE